MKMTSSGEKIRFEGILNQLSEPIMIIDHSGRTIFFNEAIKRFEPLIGKHFTYGDNFIDLVSAERQKIVSTILQEVSTSKTAQTTEAQYYDQEGKSVYFEVVYSPVLNETNDLVSICIIAHDITHQKTFERKVVQLLQELTNLVENANAFIFSVDSREYITEWNRLSAQLTGYDKSEVLAQKIEKFIDKKCYEKLSRQLPSVFEGRSVSNFELLIKPANTEKLLTILVNATPRLNSAGHAVGAMFVGQDITELSTYRSSLEQKVLDRTMELREALRKEKELVDIKNRFIAIASHEFKIPLSTISSATEFLRSNPHLRQDDHEKVTKIESSVSRMKDLLEDVLTAERSEYEKLKANTHTFDLIPLLNEIIDEVLTSSRHHHRIVSHFDLPSVEITSDNKLLRNVFVNLLSNAVKFSPDNPEIHLTVRVIHDTIEVEVKDSGIGIPEEDMEKLFIPFNRGANTLNIKGTGLGLSIAKKAIETLGGSVHVSSELKKGTTVTVKLNQNIKFTL